MSDHFQWPDHPLWRYALRVYDQPTVQSVCLRLQDEHGLQVNLLLAAGWLGSEGRLLPESGWQTLMAVTADWQHHGIQALRAWRRALPKDIDLAFRRQALHLELQAEALEHRLIWSALAVQPVSSMPVAAARENLQAYWQAARPGTAAPPELSALAAALQMAVG